MKARHLTPKHALSVHCPFCSVAPGKRCELGSGGLRNSPHAARELFTLHVFEKKTVKDRSVSHLVR